MSKKGGPESNLGIQNCALLVIAGTPPLDLLARERNEIHKKGVKKKKEKKPMKNGKKDGTGAKKAHGPGN
jgi:hypothetical protein